MAAVVVVWTTISLGSNTYGNSLTEPWHIDIRLRFQIRSILEHEVYKPVMWILFIDASSRISWKPWPKQSERPPWEKCTQEEAMEWSIKIWVKDSADPCDCIKDLNDSQPIKKTQIVSMSMLTLLSLVNTSLSLKFWCVSTSLSSSSSFISTQFHLTVINITIFTCQSCISWLIDSVQSHRQWWCEEQYEWQWHEWQWQFWWQ